MIIWAVIPIKPLLQSKSRLAHLLAPQHRAALMHQFLGHALSTLTAVSTISQTLVVTCDQAALTLAQQHGATTLKEDSAQGLNRAVFRAAHLAAQNNVDGILILPADLPFMQPQDIHAMINGFHTGTTLPMPRLAICADTKQEGTNALLLPPSTNFQFQYGLGSFNKHLREAMRVGLHPHVIHAPGLQFDLDTEADWHHFSQYQV